VALNILEALIEETYLATFIFCGFCFFVLPTEAMCPIYLTVFEAVSKVAQGECLNLSIPTLTSIY